MGLITIAIYEVKEVKIKKINRYVFRIVNLEDSTNHIPASMQYNSTKSSKNGVTTLDAGGPTIL